MHVCRLLAEGQGARGRGRMCNVAYWVRRWVLGGKVARGYCGELSDGAIGARCNFFCEAPRWNIFAANEIMRKM